MDVIIGINIVMYIIIFIGITLAFFIMFFVGMDMRIVSEHVYRHCYGYFVNMDICYYGHAYEYYDCYVYFDIIEIMFFVHCCYSHELL